MYNSPVPPKSELPTSAQLLKSTLIAAGVAATLLVTVVLPSEYNVDPTGVGKVLGLKQMGEIKSQLGEEAEADRQRDLKKPVQSHKPSTGQQSSSIGQFFASLFVSPAYAHDGKDQYDPQSGETSVKLAPGEGLEVKLEMHKGDVVAFDWTANGAKVNFNHHGEAEGASVVYEKGRAVAEKKGEFEALFDGEHGWWWRNRTGDVVTITLRTNGRYGDIKEYR
ncbi:MAG: transmembrane anchor protein [Pseudomonadota bacterium]